MSYFADERVSSRFIAAEAMAPDVDGFGASSNAPGTGRGMFFDIHNQVRKESAGKLVAFASFQILSNDEILKYRGRMTPAQQNKILVVIDESHAGLSSTSSSVTFAYLKNDFARGSCVLVVWNSH